MSPGHLPPRWLYYGPLKPSRRWPVLMDAGQSHLLLNSGQETIHWDSSRVDGRRGTQGVLLSWRERPASQVQLALVYGADTGRAGRSGVG